MMATVPLKVLILLGLLKATSSEIFKCKWHGNFTLDRYSNSTRNISNVQLEVDLDYDHLKLYGHEEKGFITFWGKDVTVNMAGFYAKDVGPVENYSKREKFKASFNEILTGSARLEPLDNITHVISDCRLILLLPDAERLSTSVIARNNIRRFAETCLEYHVCKDFERIDLKKSVQDSNNRKFCLPPGKPASLTEIKPDEHGVRLDFGPFQDFTNKIIDLVLNNTVSNALDKDGALILPNITHRGSSGIYTLEIRGGKFRGLTKLRRYTDLNMTKIGEKFKLTMGFKLPLIELEFPQYKFTPQRSTVRNLKNAANNDDNVSKQNLVNVNGQLNVTVDGIKLDTAVSVDYSQRPCVQKIEKIKIVKIGDIKVSLTGFGPWSGLFEKVANIITDIWHRSIAKTLERSLIENGQRGMANSNCERFRP